MKEIKLIGLNGQRNAGKDTVFTRMQASPVFKDRELIRVASADILKQSVCSLFQIDINTLEELKNNEDHIFITIHDGGVPRPMNMRTLLIRYGNEAHRDTFGEDFWIRMTGENVKKIQKDNPNAIVVLTDLRFINEANFIKEAGGIVCEVIGSQREQLLDENGNPVLGEDRLPSSLVDLTLDNSIRALASDGSIDYTHIDNEISKVFKTKS